jgi:hypothetical protein
MFDGRQCLVLELVLFGQYGGELGNKGIAPAQHGNAGALDPVLAPEFAEGPKHRSMNRRGECVGVVVENFHFGCGGQG